MSNLEKNLYKRVSVAPAKTEDLSKNKVAYRGFSTTDITRDSYNLYNFEIVKQDIVNHFHIRKGEKLSDPTFGTIIWDVLFEPFTEELREAILDDVTTIINYDPRVNVSRILVDSYESGIQVEADIIVIPYNLQQTMQFKFDQAAGLTD
jgi:phage baseplate assembly protein W